MPSYMPSYVLLVSLGEAVALIALFAALWRTRLQVQRMSVDPDAALMQMRDLVQEAQSLSALLASQLTAQVQAVDQEDAPLQKPQGERTPSDARVAAARTALRDGVTIDRDAARARGMDPLGLALQRSLPRGTRPAS